MKKVLVCFMLSLMAVPVIIAGGAGEETAVVSTLSADEAAVYDNVEPLAEKTHLVISTHAGTHHGFIVYLIEQFGGYEKAGIDPEIITFNSGPVQMESLTSNSWDCGTTGLGGVLNGVLRNGLIVLGPAARDNASINIYAKNDSDIVQTGPTTSHNVYGTAEQWRGREILATTGSTVHYTLALGLQDLGLSLDDVKITHMDVSGVNTALLAGRADIGGVWGAYAYSDAMNSNYTPVMKASDLESNISVTLVANPNSYADPAKKAAIDKFVELFYATVDWVYGNGGANLDKAAEYYTAISEMCGVSSTVDANMITLTEDRFYTLEEAYDMFHDTTADGFSPLYAGHYGPLKFYVENIGSYSPEDLENFDQSYFNSSVVDSLCNK